MILTEIGEIGVHVGNDVYVLRPSLYAMSQLGEPTEIVEIYASVMSELESRERFRDALAVIHSCTDSDLSHVFGYLNGNLKYVIKLADPRDILPLARALLRHGITGALPEQPRKSDESAEFTKEFVARDHVATVVAHLGVSEREAWQMSMTSLVGALRAKFPQVEKSGAKAPSKEEHDATMEWFEAVERKRNGG